MRASWKAQAGYKLDKLAWKLNKLEAGQAGNSRPGGRAGKLDFSGQLESRTSWIFLKKISHSNIT